MDRPNLIITVFLTAVILTGCGAAEPIQSDSQSNETEALTAVQTSSETALQTEIQQTTSTIENPVIVQESKISLPIQMQQDSQPQVRDANYIGRGTPDSDDGFANLRDSMDYSDKSIVFPVSNGHILEVSATDDPKWYWVVPDCSGYGGGYMSASVVRLFDDLNHVSKPVDLNYLGRGTSTSADGFLNVHSDPSISDGNTVDTLPNGAYGNVYSFGNKNWYYIETATGYGYVKASFIKMLKKGESEELVYNMEFGYVENSDNPQASQSAKIEYCDLRGEINTHGKIIASFMTSYVVNHGRKALVFDELQNGIRVNAVSYCRSYDVNWYELYDANDGTYYGWVDAAYIDFYE